MTDEQKNQAKATSEGRSTAQKQTSDAEEKAADKRAKQADQQPRGKHSPYAS
jgi:hypothetical protein